MRVQVSIRLRPPLAHVDDSDACPQAEPIQLQDGGQCIYRNHAFQFAHAFGPGCTNAEVYGAHAAAVENVLRGFDCTLMAYGQTGSGKTHTMMGSPDGLEPGMVPLAVDTLFESILSRSDDTSFSLRLSVLEILEERCVDLLHGRTSVVLRSTGSASNKGSLTFHGLREVTVRSKEGLLAHIQRGNAARTLGSNYRHGTSSRAHTIVRLRVEAARIITVGGRTGGAHGVGEGGGGERGGAGGGDGSGGAAGGAEGSGGGGGGETLTDTAAGVLTLVDLAGSEAASLNSNATRVSQGIAINKSLHWLKVAVHDLSARKPVVPFRNSALTRLLQPSLAGQAVVAVLVTAPMVPGASAGRDTLDALMFGQEVGTLKLAPTQNTQVDASGQALFDDFRRDFVSADSLKEAERTAAAELASALQRSSALETRLGQEQAAREALQQQLEAVETEAGAVARRNAELEGRVAQAAGGRQTLEARLADLKVSLEAAREAAELKEAALSAQRKAEAQLRAQIEALSASELERRHAAEVAQAQAEALAACNAETLRQLEALSLQKQSLESVAQAKGDLLMLKSKLYRSRSAQNRPGSAASRLGTTRSSDAASPATSPARHAATSPLSSDRSPSAQVSPSLRQKAGVAASPCAGSLEASPAADGRAGARAAWGGAAGDGAGLGGDARGRAAGGWDAEVEEVDSEGATGPALE